MALFLKYQEGGETPKYSLYGEDYDFHDLERRVYEGFDDFASTIKYGKKNHDSIYGAVKDLMKGLESGRVTFENGTFIDHEGQYHNESKEKHDNYGIAAAWILQNMSLANKIAPPTPETKDKYSSSVIGDYVLNDIFGDNPTTDDLLYFFNLDAWVDNDKTFRNNSERIKLLLNSINNVLSNFDNIVSKYDISDEEKEKLKNYLIQAKEALEDGVLSDNEYLILRKALGSGKWNELMETNFSTSEEELQEENEDAIPQGKKRYKIDDSEIEAPEGTSIDDIIDWYIDQQSDNPLDGNSINIYNQPTSISNLAPIRKVENTLNQYSADLLVKTLNDYLMDPNDPGNLINVMFNNIKLEAKKDKVTAEIREPRSLIVEYIYGRLAKLGAVTSLGDTQFIVDNVTSPNHPNMILVVDTSQHKYRWVSKYKHPKVRDNIRKQLRDQDSGISFHKRGGSLKFDGGGRVVKSQEGSDDEDWWKNVYFGITDFNPNNYNLGEYWGYKGDLNSIKKASSKKRGLTISKRSPHGTMDYTKPQEELNNWRKKYYENDADTKRAKNLEYAYKQWLSDTDENKGDFLTWYNKNLQYLYNYRKEKANSGKNWYVNDARKFNEIYDKLYHDVNEDNDYSVGRDENAYDWYGTATALRHFDRTDNNFKFNLDAISDENIRKELENLNISKASQGFIYNNLVTEPEEAPEEIPQPVEEKPEEKKPEGPISKTDPRNATLKRQGIDWGSLGKNLLPEGLAAGRLAGTLANNNRAYKILNRALHPYLQNTYERYSPVTGEFGLMLAYNLLAADYNRLAARNATSDASINYLARLDANRRANQLREQGFLKDNDEIKRTATEALLRQEDNVKRRSDVANLDRKSIHDTLREKADLAAEHIKQNWGAWDNFLSGIEQRMRTNLIERKQAYRSIMLDIAKLKATNEYNTVMYPWNLKIKAWANDSKNANLPITSYPDYNSFIEARNKALSDLENTLLRAMAQIYGLKYNPNTYSLGYKKGGKLIKKRK